LSRADGRRRRAGPDPRRSGGGCGHRRRAAPVDQAAKDALDADVDAILDEIDEVLEENAEDFVKSFVQKGGQ